jgi:hypothetical protein
MAFLDFAFYVAGVGQTRLSRTFVPQNRRGRCKELHTAVVIVITG